MTLQRRRPWPRLRRNHGSNQMAPQRSAQPELPNGVRNLWLSALRATQPLFTP